MINVCGYYWAPINGRVITWRKDGKTIDIPVGEFGDLLYDLMFDCFPIPTSGTNTVTEAGHTFSDLAKMKRLYDK